MSTDDMPEEDRHLVRSERPLGHRHEWVDMYNGGGFVKGHVERALMAFYCKWCLRIQVRKFDQSRYNLRIDPEDLEEPEDGVVS